ncbi:MAG: hypothetical protein A3G32_02045 [Deltaproteobacteria bacterium RIFCSPLOWO2_12_FULL_40_28]|nr:MAG: hypothetical protein A3C45_04350 [Deltaproteobacteria bacterium RIFCSPHIGHO2_02_FULL_40_28]OGQ21114.1 MAG: hypothetical protein A3E27_05110 [Deltaproteobacteria bacterium RIFCSPHIGHO2_12_FULL_40_32]OGQ53079.1 MAG: hypothetical protein A3G32_02045 [Deltaproteobacteria bacterium RIFCSPLOWO2_12_FULL_40_28]
MRSLQPFIEQDLGKKIVLLGGPRQVGKTHLALHLTKKLLGHYYNWDDAGDREHILKKGFLHDQFVVLDELHKYERWKGFLKGLYDKYHQNLKMMVTGSARMDVYRRGGDSLFGRHYHFRLHPLSVGEVLNPKQILPPENSWSMETPHKENNEVFQQLLKFGGFPEPFYTATEKEHERWSLQRRELLVRQDIRDLTQIHMLGLVEHLMLLLPNHVGSVLSLHSIKENLQVAYNTVGQWLQTLERLYICFPLKPYSTKMRRSLHKSSKVYLWDWSQIENEGARFENLVASHLLKATHVWRDLGHGDFELFFLRDRDRREVDFCVCKNKKPWLIVETKLAETQVSEPLYYYSQKLSVPAIQVVAKKGISQQNGPIKIISADSFLATLP